MTLIQRYSGRPMLLYSFKENKQSSHPVWAPLFLTFLLWITITSARLSLSLISLWLFISTHFDGRFISIVYAMKTCLSVGVCRMFQYLDNVSLWVHICFWGFVQYLVLKYDLWDWLLALFCIWWCLICLLRQCRQYLMHLLCICCYGNDV